MKNQVKVGVVGPCAAGKTTLTAALTQRGYLAKHIAQEHSYVPYMWRRMTNPDVLIFLDVSFELTLQRRKLDWTLKEYQEQQRRLAHARQHADLVLETDTLRADQVLERVLAFLEGARKPASPPF
jgi:deoxyadenosine/deoxycytidine kinase